MSGGQWITRIAICHLVWIVLRTFFVTPPHYLCGLMMICYKQSLLSTQTFVVCKLSMLRYCFYLLLTRVQDDTRRHGSKYQTISGSLTTKPWYKHPEYSVSGKQCHMPTQIAQPWGVYTCYQSLLAHCLPTFEILAPG